MASRLCTTRLTTSNSWNILRGRLVRRPYSTARSISQPVHKRRLSSGSVTQQELLENVDGNKPSLPVGSHLYDGMKHNSNPESPKDPYLTRVASRMNPQTRPHPVIWGDHPGPLSASDLNSYNTHGFLQLEKLLNETEISNLHNDLTSLLTNPTFHPNPRRVLEMSSSSSKAEIRSIFEIHKLSPTVKTLLQSHKLTQIARQILNSEVYIHQSRINFKPAFTGKGFYWHSDFETWHAEDGMPAPRALSFSINLMDNSYANGPLMIIPASHRSFVSCVGATPDNHHLQSLREQEIGVPDKESLALLADQAGGIKILTGPLGSAILFDSNCMHGSSDNITPFGRCNLFVVFNSVENTPITPYYSSTRRPDYIAARDFTPV